MKLLALPIMPARPPKDSPASFCAGSCWWSSRREFGSSKGRVRTCHSAASAGSLAHSSRASPWSTSRCPQKTCAAPSTCDPLWTRARMLPPSSCQCGASTVSSTRLACATYPLSPTNDASASVQAKLHTVEPGERASQKYRAVAVFASQAPADRPRMPRSNSQPHPSPPNRAASHPSVPPQSRARMCCLRQSRGGSRSSRT